MTQTLFLTDEEYAHCSHNPTLIAQKADAYIKQLYNQFENAKAQYDASSITAEQTCSILEHKYLSLKSEFNALQLQHSELNSTLDERVSDFGRIQTEKHQIHVQSIGQGGEIDRLSLEASELEKSKRQLVELIEHKDLEINEKDASIKAYLDKIVTLTDNASFKDSRISELEAELARSRASCTRLCQEKEIIERHNVWLDDELTAKINSLLEFRKAHNELEADLSSKYADLERKYNENSSTLKWKDDRVKELESKLESLQGEFCSSKDAASATEEQLSAELSTVNKLVELYKESSEEWSMKAGELEGVIKALETHASQVEKDYRERLENETFSRIACEKEVSHLKEKLEKSELELENCKKSDLQMSSFSTKIYGDSNLMLVPSIPAGISGTALAGSLLRDGWNLVKMYEKYQEAIDALRHEQLGRKQSQSILERVLHEIEEKADVIVDERAEHDRMVEAYATLNERFQHALSEQTALERTIQELKADLRRHERDYALAQKENNDLQIEVTVLLKECRDIQLRCGSASHDYDVDDQSNVDSDGIIPEQLLTFKDINGLVEQNVQFRSLVRLLSEQIESREVELKENFEKEFQKRSNEAVLKVDSVLTKAEEQAGMIESLHNSVSMYKKLYEEHKLHLSYPESQETAPLEESKDVMLLREGSHDASKMKLLEQDMAVLRGEIITLRIERDKATLEANFAQEKLNRFMKELEHQRDETNGIMARNIELSEKILDYQRKIHEASENLHVADDFARKLNMEVSVLRREKELLANSEKKACEEVCGLSEKVHRLQASLDTIRRGDELREEARSAQKRSQEDYVKRNERELAEAKKELQEERVNVRKLKGEHEISMKGVVQRIDKMGMELTNALCALADANARAAVAEARFFDLEKVRLLGIKNPEMNNEESDIMAELRAAKEEIEKLREEGRVDKDQMLQYKGIAHVNEAALKQMEASHKNFKVDAEKVKKSLEDEIASLKEQVNQLQDDYKLKAKEAESSTLLQEEAHASKFSEISGLREELTAKVLQLEALESRMSAMKDDLEKARHRWRTAQDNYERQVMLQSETIQELTKTSQALDSLQEEASELRKVSDRLRIENEELSSKWETEKLVLEDAKNGAQKRYIEINEQNKKLLCQLEALHIKLSENDNTSGALSVVKYLHRTKEIAESEISLLKQEKLRLQSQLEGALKAESAAQETLRAEHENSRSLHFTEDEFKALQLQVREMKLLRESNIQLREENKHNFEECQKLRLSAQKSTNEIKNLESLLGEKQNEVDACKRKIEMLEKRVNETFKNIDPEDYDRSQADMKQMEVKLIDKDGDLEGLRKTISDKQDVILRLEQDLARSKAQADERESRISNIMKTETSLKSDVDRQKRFITQLKCRLENLLKEREELTKKNQELSSELFESNQRRKNVVEIASEQVIKEREEKDTRIQILERTVDKLRDEVRKGKDTKNQQTEKGVGSQEKVDDLEKHKQAPKTLLDQVEKMKHGTVPEVPLSATVALLGATTNEVVASVVVPTMSPAAISAAQNTEETGKTLNPSKLKAESRKIGRRLVRPRIVKPDQPIADSNMLDTSGANAEPPIRKRSSTSEGQEGILVHETSGSDVAPPVLKKSRGSEVQDTEQDSEVPESLPSQVGDDIHNLERDEEVETGEDQDDFVDESLNQQGETEFLEDQPKVSESEQEQGQQVIPEAGSEPNDDEVAGKAQPAGRLPRLPSPMPIDDEVTGDTLGDMEIGSSLLALEEDNEEDEIEPEVTAPESSTDKLNTDETGGMAEETATDNVPKTASDTEKMSDTCATGNTSGSNQEGSGVLISEKTEVKQEEAVGDMNSPTINLNERARQRSLPRLAGELSSPPITRSRGRTIRGRGRGGRTGRGGQTPGSQGM